MLPRFHRLIFVIALVICFSSVAQAQSSNLADWVGKYPLIPKSKSRRGIYTSTELRGKLTALLGRKYYRRLVYDYYVMSPIKSIEGYLIAEMCQQHFCPSNASFMAVNLTRGDIHVAFWRSGKIEWFHTIGTAKELPYDVLHKPWWMNVPITPGKVSEITRGAR